MPTGYTAKIADGMTFEQYAMGCARAFGACVEMRDDPSDTPIPEEFKPSDYHARRIVETESRLAQVRLMANRECEAAAGAEFDDAVQLWKEAMAKASALKAKYDSVLEKVNAYVPPSPDHVAFKKFMQDQIIESIRFDCGDGYYQEQLESVRKLPGVEWRQKTIESLNRDIAYHTLKQSEEESRATSKTQWIKQLRESLKTP